MKQKALLMILDGWGIGNRSKADVIYNTPTPYMDYLNANYPHAQLLASGENVGLPDGQMGNSEVGHLNIGAGRVVYQDLVKVNRAIADGSIRQNKEIVSAYTYAKQNGKKLHLMGLVSLCQAERQEAALYGSGIGRWRSQFTGASVLPYRYCTRVWYRQDICALLHGRP